MQDSSDLKVLDLNLKKRLNNIIKLQYPDIELKSLKRFGPIKNGHIYRYSTNEFPIYIEVELKVRESNVNFWFIEIFDSSNNNSLSTASIINLHNIDEYNNISIPLGVFRQNILLNKLKLINSNFKAKHIEDIKNYFGINPSDSTWLINHNLIIIKDKNTFVSITLKYLNENKYLLKHIDFDVEVLYLKDIIDLVDENAFYKSNLKYIDIPFNLPRNERLEILNIERFNYFINTPNLISEDFNFDFFIEKFNIEKSNSFLNIKDNLLSIIWSYNKISYKLEIIKDSNYLILNYIDNSNNILVSKNLFLYSDFNLVINELLNEYIIKYNNLFINKYKKNIEYIFNIFYHNTLSYQQKEQILNSILNIGGTNIEVVKSGISWFILNKGYYYIEFILPHTLKIKSIINNSVDEIYTLNFSNVSVENFLNLIVNRIENIYI